MNRSRKALASGLGLLFAISAAVALNAPAAQAETGYTLCADLLNCVKITKVGDNKIGKEAGLPSLALRREQNQSPSPIELKVTQKDVKEGSTEASGDLTLGGKYKIIDIEGKLGFKVTSKTTVELGTERTLKIPPNKTGVIECWGIYETWEIKYFQRVPGPDNDKVLNAMYVYRPVPNKISCTARLK